MIKQSSFVVIWFVLGRCVQEKHQHQTELLENRLNDELSTRALSLLFRPGCVEFVHGSVEPVEWWICMILHMQRQCLYSVVKSSRDSIGYTWYSTSQLLTCTSWCHRKLTDTLTDMAPALNIIELGGVEVFVICLAWRWFFIPPLYELQHLPCEPKVKSRLRRTEVLL